MDFDLEKMPGFGANKDDDDEENVGDALTDMVKKMMKSVFGDNVPESIENIGAGDLTNIMLDVEQQLGMLGGYTNDEEDYEEIDFEELLKGYSPECEDEADIRFKEAVKDWLTASLPAIDEEGVTMLGVAFDDDFDDDYEDVGEMFFAYHDEDEPWDLGAWLDSYAGSLDADIITDWLNAKGADIDSDRIFDIMVIAVRELIEDGFIKSCFGSEIPFVVTDGRYEYTTALWTAKANGKELLDRSFFEACGLYDDDELDEFDDEFSDGIFELDDDSFDFEDDIDDDFSDPEE